MRKLLVFFLVAFSSAGFGQDTKPAQESKPTPEVKPTPEIHAQAGESTLPKQAPEAKPGDVDTLDHIMAAIYDVISGPAGERALKRNGTAVQDAGAFPHMSYLSGIIGKPVHDAAGEAFDTIADLVIYHGTEKFPRITGILLNGDRSRVAVIPWSAVAEFTTNGVRLRVERRSLAPRPLQPDEILLREDILDTQVVRIVNISFHGNLFQMQILSIHGV